MMINIYILCWALITTALAIKLYTDYREEKERFITQLHATDQAEKALRTKELRYDELEHAYKNALSELEHVDMKYANLCEQYDDMQAREMARNSVVIDNGIHDDVESETASYNPYELTGFTCMVCGKPLYANGTCSNKDCIMHELDSSTSVPFAEETRQCKRCGKEMRNTGKRWQCTCGSWKPIEKE